MELQHLTPDQIKKTMQTDPDVIVSLIFYLIDENTKLKHRIKELEDRLNQNSNNSSKAPSRDGYQKPNPKASVVRAVRKAVDNQAIKRIGWKCTIIPITW